MSKALEKQRERLRNRLGSSEINFARQEASIKQANETTRTAKGIWFGLLAYMAFVGVTLMGVEDVDFFIPERQTTLPLVNVAVPTFLFMAIAPVLGALVYAYFHMHLMKHWEALAKLPPRFQGDPISDHITPWLVSDFALALRNDDAIPLRPLREATNLVNIFLAFVGTPLLLLAFWWRSAVPHYEWLTLFVNGGSFLFSVVLGLVSWKRLATLMKDNKASPSRLSRRTRRNIIVFAILITLVGWFRTEGSLAQYARDIGISKETIASNMIFQAPFPGLILEANLQGVNFANVPDNWMTPEQDRIAYRPRWCSDKGLHPSICGKGQSLDEQQTLVLSIQRNKYCEELAKIELEKIKCQSLFLEFETEFSSDWERQWNLKLHKILSFDFGNADLQHANLVDAQLHAADLSRAQLQGADLSRAQLQGADLSGAQVQGARLGGAQLQGADLFGAQLQGAKLWNAWLQGAHVQRAQFQGAEFSGAQLQGIYLFDAQFQNAYFLEAQFQGTHFSSAQLQGAYLYQAQFDASTSLSAVLLRGAALREVDFTVIPDFEIDLSEVFGDSTVEFPEGVVAPNRFNRTYESDYDFEKAWHTFQKEIGFDPDDPSTWDKRKD